MQQDEIVVVEARECFLYSTAACAAVVGRAVAAEGGNVEGGEAVKGVAGVVAGEA